MKSFTIDLEVISRVGAQPKENFPNETILMKTNGM